MCIFNFSQFSEHQVNQFHGEFSEEEALAKAIAASMAESAENSSSRAGNKGKNGNKRSQNSRISREKENLKKTQIKCLAPGCNKMFRADIMPRYVFLNFLRLR